MHVDHQQINVCKQLHDGWHYAVDRNEGLKYLQEAFTAFQAKEVSVRLMDPNNCCNFNDPDLFTWVQNNVPDENFSGLKMVDLCTRLQDAKHDENRGNWNKNLGYCGINNPIRNRETYGIAKPNTFTDTLDPETQELFVEASKCLLTFINKIEQLNTMFQSNPERRAEFADKLAKDVPGVNILEALTLHKLVMKISMSEDGTPLIHAKPWAVRYWEALQNNDSRTLLEMRAITFAVIKHLLGCHSDTYNDRENDDFSHVFNANEWLWDAENSTLIRIGMTGYGKQAAHEFMEKLAVLKNLILEIEKAYAAFPDDVKMDAPYVDDGKAPHVLSGAHTNKLGVYYATFGWMIRELISTFALQNPHVWAAALIVISTRAAHKPSLFYNTVKKVLDDPCCYGTDKHIAQSDVEEFVWLIYADMDSTEKAEKAGTVPGDELPLRMQPFHNSMMSKDNFHDAIVTLTQCAKQLYQIDADELKKNMHDYYHQIVCVLTMNAAHSEFTSLFGVTGIQFCGPLSVHSIIGIAAVVGLFPSSMLAHAEIPASTSFDKIFDQFESDAARAAYHDRGHYLYTQELLKALSVYLNVTIAVAEEIICQVKGLHGLSEVPSGRTRDVIFPRVPFLKFNTTSDMIEAWFGTDNGERRMMSVTPLYCVSVQVNNLHVQVPPGFFKAPWPMKQKNTTKYRKSKKETPLNKLCTMKSLSSRPAQILGGSPFSWLNMAGSEIMGDKRNLMVSRKNKTTASYCLDISEPGAELLMTTGNVTVISPQSIVHQALQPKNNKEGSPPAIFECIVNAQGRPELFQDDFIAVPDGYEFPYEFLNGGVETHAVKQKKRRCGKRRRSPLEILLDEQQSDPSPAKRKRPPQHSYAEVLCDGDDSRETIRHAVDEKQSPFLVLQQQEVHPPGAELNMATSTSHVSQSTSCNRPPTKSPTTNSIEIPSGRVAKAGLRRAMNRVARKHQEFDPLRYKETCRGERQQNLDRLGKCLLC